MFQNLNRTLHIVILLFISYPLFALSEDQHQPMHIVANSSQYNYKDGISTYEGNVLVEQGTSHLIADRVTTKNNEQHKIAEAIAYGINKLAVYTTIPKIDEAIFTAKANVIKFYPPKSLIILEGNVSVIQGENSFHGPLIIYNTKEQVITTLPSKNGRATVMITPT